MASVEEKGNDITGSIQDDGGDMTDMYHAVLKDPRDDLKTEGNDVKDMYRLGKKQEFKVRPRLLLFYRSANPS